MKNKANWDSFVLTGCNADPSNRDGSLDIGVFDFFTWGQVTLQNNHVYVSIAVTHSDPNTYWNTGYTIFSVMNDAAKPKFSGSPHNLPLNAVICATKQSSNPVTWINPVAIDCNVDVDVQICDSYAINNQTT
ncbi:MAG: hypothetical protein EZS28_031571 [Streblomastix strix]|uniref:Uncharacterized protein n=1 Tax=Streblomastix strix TaxID=222440 RepID=A0A5J4URD0_9EUKA|nr:MAG: hypothetical protein EZS28_031571 [Streblomastix strix]